MFSTAAIVRQNTLRVYLYMFILTLIITTLGYAVSHFFKLGLTGTGSFLIIAGIVNYIAFFFSDTIIIKTSRAKPLTKEQAPEYVALVEDLSRKADLPMPKLYYLAEDAMNAFATGRNPKRAAVVVTRGLLEKLTPEEVKGVIAHELAHVKSLDTRVMAVVTILAGLISILADMYWHSRLLGRVSERDRSGVLEIVGFVLALIAPISAFLIQLAISRRREYAADALGGELIQKPSYLAQALEKMSRDQLPLPAATRVTAHLYISNPLKSEGFLDRIFSTHPQIEDRIKLLRAMHIS